MNISEVVPFISIIDRAYGSAIVRAASSIGSRIRCNAMPVIRATSFPMVWTWGATTATIASSIGWGPVPTPSIRARDISFVIIIPCCILHRNNPVHELAVLRKISLN